MGIEICWENFEIFIYKSQCKIDFLSIFYPFFPDLCHFIQLWKIIPFSTTILSVSGGGKLPPHPCGRPWFFAYFSINLRNHALIFCAFGRKMQIVENFEKPSENCENFIILAFFKRILTNHALIFSRLDEKHKLLGNFEKIF